MRTLIGSKYPNTKNVFLGGKLENKRSYGVITFL